MNKLESYLKELNLIYTKEYSLFFEPFIIFRIDYVIFNKDGTIDIIEEKSKYDELLKACGQLIIYKKLCELKGLKVRNAYIFVNENNVKVEFLKKLLFRDGIIILSSYEELRQFFTI